MNAFIGLVMLIGGLALLAYDLGIFLVVVLVLAVVILLNFLVMRPGLLLALLGIGALFSLFGGDDCDCDL